MQKTDRIAARQQQAPIGLAQGMLQRTVTNVRPLSNRYCIRLLPRL